MENKDTLDELNKGCTMGIDALNFVIDKAEDLEFKKVLEGFYSKYQKLHNDIEAIYPNYTKKDDDPTETNVVTKVMTWSAVEMKTLTDTSNSKIAEILLQGTNMGIIEGRKLLNHKENLDKDVDKILHEYVNMQEEEVETLKKYL